MTQWNPLNLFSSSRQSTGDTPSSGFDPTRIGDPVVPTEPSTGIGIGDVGHVGHPEFVDRPRHPIGFAPPEAQPAPHFRTELSFKRHHDLPRASAESNMPEDSTPSVWRTPAVEHEADPGPQVAAESPTQEDATDFEKIPFYKRELSFRRKRPAQVDAALAIEDGAQAAAEEPDAADPEPLLTEAKPPVPVVAAESDRHDLDDGESPGESLPSAATVSADETDGSLEPAPSVAEDTVAEHPVAVTGEGMPAADAVAVSAPDAHEEIEADADADADPRPEAGTTPDPGSPTPESAGEPVIDSADATAQAAATPGKRRLMRAGGNPKRAEKATGRRSRGKGKRIVGLKIGASQLAAAVVVETESGQELVQLARRPLEHGIVVDGEVRDREALANALKAFFQSEDLPRRDVRLGLGSNRIGVRIFDIAGVEDEARFDNAVRFKAHEALPVAVNESVLDYRVLEDRLNENGEPTRRVLLVVAPRDQVQPYVEVAERAGLALAGIDLEALGLLRAFVEPVIAGTRKDDDTATVVVAIGHESSTLLVASRGVCEFTRVFDWGGGVLQDAIAQELEVPAAEAETILRHISLAGPGRKLESLDDGQRAMAVTSVRNRLTPFARELVNSLQFYQTQPESLGIGGIVITGGTSQLEGLGGELRRIIGVNVTVGDPLSRVVVRDNCDAGLEDSIGSLAVPIGLAIDDLAMRGIDISTQRQGRTKGDRKSTLLAVGVPVAAVVPLIALGALYFGAHGAVNSHQSELDAVQAQINALPKPAGPTIDPALAGTDAQRAVGVANILGGRIAWETMFRDVSRILPENVWLTAMTATAPAQTASAAGGAASPAAIAPSLSNDVTITGATYTQTDVARFLARLATLPSLSSVSLVSSTAQQAKGQKQTVQFEIVASLNTSGGGAS